MAQHRTVSIYSTVCTCSAVLHCKYVTYSTALHCSVLTILQTGQHEPKGQILFCLGNLTGCYPLPHPVSPPPIPLGVTQGSTANKCTELQVPIQYAIFNTPSPTQGVTLSKQQGFSSQCEHIASLFSKYLGTVISNYLIAIAVCNLLTLGIEK